VVLGGRPAIPGHGVGEVGSRKVAVGQQRLRGWLAFGGFSAEGVQIQSFLG
jgi:hypothetical protein